MKDYIQNLITEKYITELSKEKIGQYIKKSAGDELRYSDNAKNHRYGSKTSDKFTRKSNNRFKGLGQAVNKLTGKAKVAAK